MKTREYYKELLRQADGLTAEGRYDDAHALLAPLIAEGQALAPVLGSMTSLGLPRRLQSSLLKLAKAQSDPLRKIGYQYHLVPPPQAIGRHVTFDADARRRMAGAATQAVPRVLHQIWIGPKPVPVTVGAWQDNAQRHGYAHRLWREADLEAIGAYDNPLFAEMLAGGDFPGAVDVARYIILASEGGIYLDCDWFPAREGASFHHLLPLTGLHAFAEAVPRNTGLGSLLLANSFIAAPPGHPVFDAMLAALPGLRDELPGAPAWWITGPLLFTVAARMAPLCLATTDFVFAEAGPKASLEEIEALAAEAEKCASGLLIAWKPW